MLSLAVGGSVWLVQAQENDRKVNDIAWHFKCICEMNCNLTVASCHCHKKGGAAERKAYIRKLLKENRPRSEIMALVTEKFGGLIEVNGMEEAKGELF